MDQLKPEVIISFVFGVIFIGTLVLLAIKFPNPTPFQYNVFRIILCLAAAGVGAVIPGFLKLDVSVGTYAVIRSGGALALFGVVFFFNPAPLAVHASNASVPSVPEKLPNGAPFPAEKKEVFLAVWRALIALDKAGQSLWERVDIQI